MPVPVREHSGQMLFFFSVQRRGCFLSEVTTSWMCFFQDGSICYKTRISFYVNKESCSSKCCWEEQNFVSRAPVNRNNLNRLPRKKKEIFAIQSETLPFQKYISNVRSQQLK